MANWYLVQDPCPEIPNFQSLGRLASSVLAVLLGCRRIGGFILTAQGLLLEHDCRVQSSPVWASKMFQTTLKGFAWLEELGCEVRGPRLEEGLICLTGCIAKGQVMPSRDQVADSASRSSSRREPTAGSQPAVYSQRSAWNPSGPILQ